MVLLYVLETLTAHSHHDDLTLSNLWSLINIVLTRLVLRVEGYKNITSIMISLHVGLDLRAWWGDDFKFGWTDNSCEAASCRARVVPQRVKRETVKSALRRGIWHWTPEGLLRLDDNYIWDSAN